MRRLQIGMWNNFSEEFWGKYSSDDIKGIEISQYPNKSELEQLVVFCQNKKIKFGIHTPVFGDEKTLPEIISFNKNIYSEVLIKVEEQVKLAAEFGADYLLLHYPFPPIYETVVDRRYWTGPPEHAFYYNEDIKEEDFKIASERLFHDLSVLQRKYHQKIVLEYDFFGGFEDIFVNMFNKYRDLQLVIDTQRMEHHKRTFPNFDPYKWMDKIKDYVYLVHYSNVYFGENVKRHLPVLPNQSDHPEYGDSYKYLKYLSDRNSFFHVTFEHNPSLISKKELDICFSSVKELIGE
ncbi:sugar phosphate isomerase/epimerase [Bacillus sp. CGMCC 1.16607]|uniref:sugar phosphate isomerase/epimerase n=1 Tax=Bacillus sp. CGMCC 1.16607 TaxID=3351842 RepID=UPI00362CD088